MLINKYQIIYQKIFKLSKKLTF